MNDDERWMMLAIEEAKLAESSGEIPVGAVLVKDNILIAKAHNETIIKNDATAHAEINLLRLAGSIMNNYRLVDTTIYSTLEPCAMCFSALINARISKLVFGAYDFKTGVCGSCADLRNSNFYNHQIQITGGVLLKENQDILQSFFKKIRLKKN